MRTTELRLTELAMIASTRALLGAGVGLLLAGRMGDRRRRLVGRTLLAVGALSTAPLAWLAYQRRRPPA